MKYRQVLSLSLKSIYINKSRTLLTMLGVIIGIASIIIITSIGKSAEKMISGQLQEMGTRNIFIRAGGDSNLLDIRNFFLESLKEKDIQALKSNGNVAHLKRASGFIYKPSTVEFSGESFAVDVVGMTEDAFSSAGIEVNRGEQFVAEDIEAKSLVAIVGSNVANKLFHELDPLGSKIRVNGRPLKIVGVLKESGPSSFGNPDDWVVVPVSVAKDYLFGIDYYTRIIVEIDDDKYVDEAVSDVKTTLRDSHDIEDPSKDDFSVFTQKDIAEKSVSIISALSGLLSAIAAISLIVGGIGIMNIMLVAVTERTREIGLRKAVGAKERDILQQFLLEAVIVTVSGGTVGIIFGFIFSFVLAIIFQKFVSPNWEFVLATQGAIIGFFVSFIVGIVFGFYPARSAAKKNPIDALRYE